MRWIRIEEGFWMREDRKARVVYHVGYYWAEYYTGYTWSGSVTPAHRTLQGAKHDASRLANLVRR